MNSSHKFIICLSIAIICIGTAHSQEISLRVKQGYGFHNMTQLKSLSKSILNFYQDEYEIYMKNYNSFPPYWNFQVQAVMMLPDRRNGIGVVGDLISTGSRNHYADYSGELKNDLLVRRYAIGAHLENMINPDGKYKLGVMLQILVNRTKLEIIETFDFADTVIDEKLEFNADGVALNPGVFTQLKVWELLSLRAEISYEYALTRDLYQMKRERKLFLQSENGVHIRPQWNGLRIGFLLLVDF